MFVVYLRKAWIEGVPGERGGEGGCYIPPRPWLTCVSFMAIKERKVLVRDGESGKG